jgi:hypothetical protein
MWAWRRVEPPLAKTRWVRAVAIVESTASPSSTNLLGGVDQSAGPLLTLLDAGDGGDRRGDEFEPSSIVASTDGPRMSVSRSRPLCRDQ